MEITHGGISMISRHSPGKPVLVFTKLVKSNPVVEVMLTDGKDFLEFMVDQRVSSPFTSSEISLNEPIQLDKYEILSEAPTKKVKITAFYTQRQKYYSVPEDGSARMSTDSFVPIAALSPHNPDFIIKARVLKKGEVRQYNSKFSGSQGKLFSIELIDKNSSEISATFFERAVEKFYDMLQEGNVYTFSRGTCKFSNSRFNTSGNMYQLTFDERSLIEEVPEDSSIKKVNFNLTNIMNLSSLPPRSKVDVAGVIVDVSSIMDLSSRKGEPLQKRTVSLADSTSRSIELTLWNDEANRPEFSRLQTDKKPILIVKNAVVGDFNGLNLSTIKGVSSLHFHPTDDEIPVELREFASNYNQTDKELTPLTIKSEGRVLSIKTLAHILEELETTNLETDLYYDILARIRFINHEENKPMWYESCKKCNKKVVNENNNFRCNGCGQLSQDFNYRYMANVKLQDSSQSIYAVAFDEAATKIFNKRVVDLKEMIKNDPADFEMFLKRVVFTEHLFRIKARRERTDNGPRNKFIITSARDVDPIKVSRSLIGDIIGSLDN